MRKEWFHFLLEAGRPLIRKADAISYQREKIERLKKELQEEINNCDAMYNQLCSEVDTLFNEDEQREAKTFYANYLREIQQPA